MWERIYFEGRCRCCGMRVTVDCKGRGHTRDGQWCGPIETERPLSVPDEPAGKLWMVPWSHGLTPASPSEEPGYGSADTQAVETKDDDGLSTTSPAAVELASR